jgi:23S rRNA U2552 (ribose-2'-O)-methylase RlmE/FtsJ
MFLFAIVVAILVLLLVLDRKSLVLVAASLAVGIFLDQQLTPIKVGGASQKSLDKLYASPTFKKYQAVKHRMSSRDIYAKMDKYEYVQELYHNHYLQMLDMDRKRGFVGHKIKFLDLCSAPSAFSKYFLDKSPNNTGVGVSLDIESGGIANMLEDPRFTFHYLNILEPSQVSKVLGPHQGTFDLAVHGCHDMTEEKTAYKSPHAQSILWLTALMIGIHSLKIGGMFVYKLSNKDINFLFNVIDILHLYFSRFKCVKSDFMHNVRGTFFVICYNKKSNDLSAIERIVKTIDSMSKKPTFSNMTYEQVQLFIDDLIKNDIEVQTNAMIRYEKMMEDMQGKKMNQ